MAKHKARARINGTGPLLESANLKPRKLFKVSVKCDCGVENALLLTKAQLRHARAKCTGCGADIGTRWTNVRGA
jgi:hypothetical protein